MAEPMWERAVRGFEDIKGPDHPSTLSQLYNLGRIFQMLSRLAEAEATLERAFEGMMQALGPDGPLTQTIVQGLVLQFQNLGRMKEVMQVYDQLTG
ncbi:hypothetical protein PoHVEF18_002676 [Penicillium ochrochloron]